MLNIIEFITELLFTITGGTAIALSWWLIPYMIFFGIVLLFQIFIMNHFLEKNYKVIPILLVIIIPISFIILAGGPIWQGVYMEECYNTAAVVTTDDGKRDAIVSMCRKRDNRYDDFGEFDFSSVTLKARN